MDMVLLDDRAYTIKYVATRKKNEQAEKQEIQNRLDDAIRLLELDDGQDNDHTNELFDKVNTLKHTIQAKNDHEEEEKARKYVAKSNLEAETPSKNLCNQINKSQKNVKLSFLLQERKPTLRETLAYPTKNFANPKSKIKSEIFTQTCIISNPPTLIR